ncbi:MAG TPA: zf-HC2 domain-containing protein [Bryobacteraceae bacterium]|nr:zf-HC2 domain-containing protein [Bryobacteraceae bacterium]
MKTVHILETDLALYASGDLALARRLAVRLHLRGCDRCRASVETYRDNRNRVRDIASEMPDGVEWDRLSAEMTANIRVGLAAGECVALPARDRRRAASPFRRPLRINWRPAAITLGLVVLMSVAWLMNMPSGTTAELGQAFHSIVRGHGAVADYDHGPVVVATPLGVELRENDSAFGGSQDAAPVAVSVSIQGSASARYINADTGQMTITSVYVQ